MLVLKGSWSTRRRKEQKGRKRPEKKKTKKKGITSKKSLKSKLWKSCTVKNSKGKGPSSRT